MSTKIIGKKYKVSSNLDVVMFMVNKSMDNFFNNIHDFLPLLIFICFASSIIITTLMEIYKVLTVGWC